MCVKMSEPGGMEAADRMAANMGVWGRQSVHPCQISPRGLVRHLGVLVRLVLEAQIVEVVVLGQR